MQDSPGDLRYVLIEVIRGVDFPPPPDSPYDITLLRAANFAMQRKERGIEDALLFVIVGAQSQEAARNALSSYGFPLASVICVKTSDLRSGTVLSDDDCAEDIANEIRKWLANEHPGAISMLGTSYAKDDFWWSGIESIQSPAWPFEVEANEYGNSLPGAHRSKASTWLTILSNIADLADAPEDLAVDEAYAWAATLSEWLHGFEAASGNSYNDFSCALGSIKPSDFYLGFELARLSTGSSLTLLCDESERDMLGLQQLAVKAIVRDKRYELRDALSAFFGGDGALYWALFSTIWPDFSKPANQALEDQLGNDDRDHITKIHTGWAFVSEGWHDKADED